jgi:hypothetical protein
VSEIDFEAIEKAMAELVNKAQGQKRQSQLKVVTDKRNEQAKKIETAHEQGNLATKRIIVASTRQRSNTNNSRPKVVPPAKSISSISAPNSAERLISDFRAPPSLNHARSFGEKTFKDDIRGEKEEDLSKTVGSLSDKYLLEKVSSESPSQDDYPEEGLRVESKGTDLEKEGLSSQGYDTVAEDSTRSSSLDQKLESIVGAAASSQNTEKEQAETGSLAEKAFEEELPESDEYARNIGNIHKIYGQHLSPEHLPSSSRLKKDADYFKAQLNSEPKKVKAKRGFLFYFLILVIIISVVVWAAAAYLYLSA